MPPTMRMLKERHQRSSKQNFMGRFTIPRGSKKELITANKNKLIIRKQNLNKKLPHFPFLFQLNLSFTGYLFVRYL